MDHEEYQGHEEEEECHQGDGGVGEEEEWGETQGRGGARVPAAAVESTTVASSPAGPTCCICLEPWTCNDAHRICCIPCGHVYGRSCIESWLHRSSNTTAKCPQCGVQFEHKNIINLYAPGNLWDGCCRLQEMKGRMEQEVNARLGRMGQEMKDRMEQELNALLGRMDQEMMAHFALREELANVNAKLREELDGYFWKELAEKAAAAVKAEFVSMKEQLGKMICEQNATPMDLLRFIEQNGANVRPFTLARQ